MVGKVYTLTNVGRDSYAFSIYGSGKRFVLRSGERFYISCKSLDEYNYYEKVVIDSVGVLSLDLFTGVVSDVVGPKLYVGENEFPVVFTVAYDEDAIDLSAYGDLYDSFSDIEDVELRHAKTLTKFYFDFNNILLDTPVIVDNYDVFDSYEDIYNDDSVLGTVEVLQNDIRDDNNLLVVGSQVIAFRFADRSGNFSPVYALDIVVIELPPEPPVVIDYTQVLFFSSSYRVTDFMGLSTLHVDLAIKDVHLEFHSGGSPFSVDTVYFASSEYVEGEGETTLKFTSAESESYTTFSITLSSLGTWSTDSVDISTLNSAILYVEYLPPL